MLHLEPRRIKHFTTEDVDNSQVRLGLEIVLNLFSLNIRLKHYADEFAS
jgi:hypothetical protein